MTSNQINYRKLVEERRHNHAVERETKRANLELARNTRAHTKMQSEYNDAYIAHLSNTLTETGRHNYATEQKDLLYLNRSLGETERHNKSVEELSRQQFNANYHVALSNLEVERSRLVETNRHNQAQESLTHLNYSNQYALGLEQNRISDAKRVDTARRDTQQQLLQMQQLKETKRHNRYSENISDRQTNINALTNTSNQINQWYRSLTD